MVDIQGPLPPGSRTMLPNIQEIRERGKKTRWINKDLLSLLNGKQEIHRSWKQGQVSWNEFREVVRISRNETRKTKAHVELKLDKDVKDNKRGFFKYVNYKRKTKE